MPVGLGSGALGDRSAGGIGAAEALLAGVGRLAEHRGERLLEGVADGDVALEVDDHLLEARDLAVARRHVERPHVHEAAVDRDEREAAVGHRGAGPAEQGLALGHVRVALDLALHERGAVDSLAPRHRVHLSFP